jgi:hypothetical protein
VSTEKNYTENKAAIRMMWLNRYILHPVGASCKHVGRPAYFYPALHGFYAFLRSSITKYKSRKGEKAAGTTQNAAGSKKRPQEMHKVTQDG